MNGWYIWGDIQVLT